MKNNFFVYILECSDKSFYIGKTIDILRRIKAHNGITSGGAKYTSGRRPVFLIYYERVSTLSEALKREYQLKQLTRAQKQKLVHPK